MNAHSESSTASVETLLGQVADEFTEGLNRGEQPEIEEYARLHPEIAELLRQVLPALQVMAPLISAPSHESTEGRAALGGFLGDFRIGNEIGRGGMGIVFEAEQISLRRRVALKVLPFAATLDPKRLQRFRNEAQAAAQLHHTNIVPVFAVGSERSVHFYAMQYIEGQSLAAVIEELRRLAVQSDKQPLPAGMANGSESVPSEEPPGVVASTKTIAGLSTERSRRSKEFFRSVAELGVQAALALDYAHEMGVVHRDIKPANLLVDAGRNLWITDFGLAQIQTEAGLTMTGDLVGTIRYMSPEQALGKRVSIDHRTDIYSLGVTLYELLTLQPAFEGSERQELLQKIAVDEPVPPRRLSPAIPRELETIALKAMAKDPAERYPTAQELADDLRRFLEDKPIRARRPPWWQRGVKWVRRHRLLVGACAALFTFSIIGLALTAVLIARERDADAKREEAEAQSARLVERELTILRRFYLHDVAFAYEAWKSGDVNETLHLLRRYHAGPNPEDLSGLVRGFEWYYLWWLCNGGTHSIATLRGHVGQVFGVAFSPDDKTLASVGEDKVLRLWDVASGKIRRNVPGHTGEVNGVAFSPDGSLIATASDDHTVKLWNTDTGKLWATLPGHLNEVLCLAFSLDSKRVASGSRDKSIRIWDVATGEKIEELVGPGPIQFLVFAPDGLHLAAACEGGSISWDLGKERKSVSLPGFAGAYSIAYALHGSLLITGHKSGHVFVWNCQTGKLERSWRADSLQVDSLALSPDGGSIITASRGGALRTWNLATGEMQQQWLAHDGHVWCVTVSAKRNVLASGGADGTVKLWRLESLLAYFGQRDHIHLKCSVDKPTHIAFTSHSTNIITGHADGKVVLWDWANRRTETLRDCPMALCGLAVTPDGATMILGLENGSIEFWDLPQRKLRRTLQTNGPALHSLVVSPDGHWLGTAGAGQNSIRIWDLKKDPPYLCSFPTDGVGKGHFAFSPDGRVLAAIDPDTGTGELRELVAREPKARTIFKAPNYRIQCLQFSPDGMTLATGGSDGSLRLWDVVSGKEKALVLDSQRIITALAFCPDGKTVAATVDNRIRLINVVTAGELITLTPGGAVLAFSPDGSILATVLGSVDGKSDLFLRFGPGQDGTGMQKQTAMQMESK